MERQFECKIRLEFFLQILETRSNFFAREFFNGESV